MNKKELIEKLADLEHEQWCHWTKFFLQWQTPERRIKWDIQCKTKYKDLSEKEKESDRVWARKVLELLDASSEVSE